MYLIILLLLMGALTGLQAQLERMGASSESGHYRSLPPVTVSVHPFFLEPMKLAPFLTGSNTQREEVIATSCFDSLVCGKAKTEGRRAVPLAESRYNQHTWKCGRATAVLFCVPGCQKLWERFPVSSPSSSAASPVCAAVSGRFAEDIEVALMILQVWSRSVFLLQFGLADGQPLEVCAGNPSSPENPLSPRPLMEGPEPNGMRRMPLRVRRPFVLEQETI